MSRPERFSRRLGRGVAATRHCATRLGWPGRCSRYLTQSAAGTSTCAVHRVESALATIGLTLFSVMAFGAGAHGQSATSGDPVARAQSIARTLCKYEPSAAVVANLAVAINPLFGLAASGISEIVAKEICSAVDSAGGAPQVGRKRLQVYGVALSGRVIGRIRAGKERIRAERAKQN